MQKLLSRIRRADADFGMIRAGERVAVGVSGGKDSLALLCALAEYRRFAPNPFTLTAITVDMGQDLDGIRALCARIDVPFIAEATRITETVDSCALCARLRKGILARVCNERGLSCLALGHHEDDAVETLMLSLLCEGRVHTFEPVSLLSRSNIVQIRPMIYAKECEIAKLAARLELPVTHTPCPVGGDTRRRDIRLQIEALDKAFPGSRERLAAAVRGLWAGAKIKLDKGTFTGIIEDRS